jgi:hypothetical protein
MRGIQIPPRHRAAVVLLVAFGLALACTSERGMDPAPERYRLYVGVEGDYTRVFAVDTESDSIIDSTDSRLFLTSIPLATPDGKYLLVQRVSAPTEVLNTADLSLVTELPGCGTRNVLAAEEGLIIGVRRTCLSYVSYPGFELLGTDSILVEDNANLGVPAPSLVDLQRGLVYGWLSFGEDHVDSVHIVAWDYRHRCVSDHWNFAYAFPEGGVRVLTNILSPDGNSLYGLADTPQGPLLFCYDLRARTLVWDQCVLTPLGDLRLAPDGKELWHTDRGFVEWPIIAGYVFIHDPATGAVTDSISMFGYAPNPLKPLPAREIVFTPDGRKAYVAASDISYSTGPVFVIDVARREITDLLFDDFQHLPYWLSIGPAP